ncbi:MAG: hypothetical protein GY909_01110 [Oligoflexia bacterium]|nr:hypothetical protein [Oligoflexia bacterium]
MTQSKKINIIATISMTTIILNLIFHILKIDTLISPFGFPAVMTFFTTISLSCLTFYFLVNNESIKLGLLTSSFLIQLISITLLSVETNISNIFFLSSSLPTSLYLILLTTILVFPVVHKTNLSPFWGYFLFGVNILFLFGFLSKNMYILGVSKENIGVGLSPYTLINFFLLTSIVFIKYAKQVNLKQINIKYSPKVGFTFLSFVFISNFLLTFCTGKNQTLTSLVMNISYLAISYQIFVKPFTQNQDLFMTVCAWTNKVKNHNNEWVNQDEIFESMGIQVTHGISPEEAIRVKDKYRAINRKAIPSDE